MFSFIAEHLVEIFFGLVSAGALAACKHFHKQIKDYKALLEEKEDNELKETIDSRLEPIQQELEDLRKYVRETREIEKSHINLIIASYRFRLIQLCKIYLKQGYMTPEQYDQLNEFYKVYRDLGGNGQAKEYYDLASALPIRPE